MDDGWMIHNRQIDIGRWIIESWQVEYRCGDRDTDASRDVATGISLRGTRGQTANIRWIMEKAREFQENIYFCFIDYAKAFDCVDHNKLWKILREMGIPGFFIVQLSHPYMTT